MKLSSTIASLFSIMLNYKLLLLSPLNITSQKYINIRTIHKWTTRNTIAIGGANNGVRLCYYCRVCKLLVWGRMLMQYLLQLLSLPKLMKF
jgi:hypothetical protein